MSLKKQFITGVFFSAGAKYIGLLIQLVITGILSRILTPNDFGVVAIATVFIVFFNLLGDAGIGAAIIQDKTLSAGEIKNIFSISIYIGIILAIVFFFVADMIANFYNRPSLKVICQLLSINILFASINVVPNALLLREKLFKFIAARTLLIQVVSGAAGITAAFSGWKVHSLLVYSISASCLLFLVNYQRNPLSFQIIIDMPALKKIYKYSAYQFLFNFINYFSRNLDKLLIGKFLSPAILGYYDKAYRLMLLPVENLTHVLSPVIHPLFSDFQHDKQRIFESYLKIVRVLAFVGFPLGVFLHFSAKELVLIIFGSQWQDSIPVFEVLAWSVGIQIILSSSGAIFQAANNTKLLFVSGLLSALMMILGIVYGVFIEKSLIGTAYGLLVAFSINFIQAYFLLIKILHGSFVKFIGLFKIPLAMSVLVFAGEYLLSRFITVHELLISLAFKAAIAGTAMAIGLLIMGEFKLTLQSVGLMLKK